MSEKKEYIERGAVYKTLRMVVDVDGCESSTAEIDMDAFEAIQAADVVEVVRCKDCKHGTPLTRNAYNVRGIHCCNGRGDEVRNVWHKYSRHYEDYSLVDENGFCDQGEARETQDEE